MTLEKRMQRAERMLIMFANSGRRYRAEFRAEHREMNEKINILINAQIATDEQIKKTDEQIKRTDEQIEKLTARTNQQIEKLTANQAKTDEALRRFLNSLKKGRNGADALDDDQS